MGARMGSWRAGLAPGPEPGAHRQRAQVEGAGPPRCGPVGGGGGSLESGARPAVSGAERWDAGGSGSFSSPDMDPPSISVSWESSQEPKGQGLGRQGGQVRNRSSGSRNRADDGSGLSARSEARPRRSPVDGCGRWSCPGSTAASRIPTGSPKTARTSVLGGRGDSAALELPEAHRDSPQPPRE